jgi:hypothetical protein
MKLYGDHPQTPDRISKSQQEIGTILPPREQYIVSSSDFEQAKKRLALVMKYRQRKDGKGKPEEDPQLRRTVGDKPSDQNDDRPVIKKQPGNK